jgi:hypothetical protein
MANGQTRDFAVSDARRIYLMPARARAMFPGATGGVGIAAGASGRAVINEDGSFQVPGRAQWLDTGLTVRRGDPVRFLTTGTVQIRDGGPAVNGEGDAGVQSASYPVPGMPAGALIARIGDNPPFPLGQRSDAVAMPHDGILRLGINDDNFGDNSGAFRVAVLRRPQDGADTNPRSAGALGAMNVAADTPWRDAGINVSAGERLYFEVTGSVDYGGGNTAGPNGRDGVMNHLYPVPSTPVGALIGRINLEGKPFLIGGPHGPITMPASGRLLLGVNDDIYTDNRGNFVVRVWR